MLCNSEYPVKVQQWPNPQAWTEKQKSLEKKTEVMIMDFLQYKANTTLQLRTRKILLVYYNSYNVVSATK